MELLVAGRRTYVFVATVKIDVANSEIDIARLHRMGSSSVGAQKLLQDVMLDPATELDELKIIEVAYP